MQNVKSKVLANVTVLCHKYIVTGNGKIMQSNVEFYFVSICDIISGHLSEN